MAGYRGLACGPSGKRRSPVERGGEKREGGGLGGQRTRVKMAAAEAANCIMEVSS